MKCFNDNLLPAVKAIPLVAVEESSGGEAPNPNSESEEEENREDIPLPEEPADTLAEITKKHQKDLSELFNKEERKK